MKEAGAKALIAVDASIYPDIWPKVEAIRAVLPDLKVFRVAAAAAVPRRDRLRRGAAPLNRAIGWWRQSRSRRDTVAALFHTGGTTGLPKLAKHTHGALALMAWTNTLMFDLGPGTVLLNPLPQFHVGGSLFGALAPIANGWTVVIPTPLGRAQSQRGARLLEHRRAQPRHRRGRRADDAGGDHERAARGPRSLAR